MALSRRSRLAALATTIISIACGGGGGGMPPPQNALAKAPTSGDGQVVNAGQTLPNPLAVIVKDPSGNPVNGVTITWAPTVGGGTVGSSSSTTGADGIATTTLATGSDSVVQKVTASGANLSGSPVTFTATARIQGATQIAFASPSNNGQTDTVLAMLKLPYRAILRDENNAVVPNVTVTWTAVGGGSVNGSGTTTTTSGSTGVDSVTRTLGTTAGAQTATATVRGLIGSPVTFTSTATAGAANQIAVNGGNNQAGPILVPLPNPHTVIVRDKYGNPKPNFTVTWVVPSGNGSVSPSTPLTNASGIASVTRTLGGNIGVQHDTAKFGPLSDTLVAFSDTAGAVAAVQVGNNFFNPATLNVSSDTYVIWTWAGGVGHNVTWLTAPGALPQDCSTRSSGTCVRRLLQLGAYTYECSIHPAQMQGTVNVQ